VGRMATSQAWHGSLGRSAHCLWGVGSAAAVPAVDGCCVHTWSWEFGLGADPAVAPAAAPGPRMLITYVICVGCGQPGVAMQPALHVRLRSSGVSYTMCWFSVCVCWCSDCKSGGYAGGCQLCVWFCGQMLGRMCRQSDARCRLSQALLSLALVCVWFCGQMPRRMFR
jgi:hypothetical protein